MELHDAYLFPKLIFIFLTFQQTRIQIVNSASNKQDVMWDNLPITHVLNHNFHDDEFLQWNQELLLTLFCMMKCFGTKLREERTTPIQLLYIPWGQLSMAFSAICRAFAAAFQRNLSIRPRQRGQRTDQNYSSPFRCFCTHFLET